MVWRGILLIIGVIVGLFSLTSMTNAQNTSGILLTVYDRGTATVFLTAEKTVKAALATQKIELDKRDVVEPSLDEELIASEYHINIYRARPVVVVDGQVRVKTISAFQTPKEIAEDAGIAVYDEDRTSLRPSEDFIGDGAGLQLTIQRAKTITLDLYGKVTEVRTRANTVQELLTEKGIVVDQSIRVSVPLSAAVTQNMAIRISKEGVQTLSIDEEIPVLTRLVYDVDRPLGYRVIQSAGTVGVRSNTYQLEVKDGVEISRRQIASIVTKAPTEQLEVIGLRNDGAGLSANKGAQYWTDSKGVSHRETYYDLNMSVVMQSCGQGGYYTVRPDGAKVDAAGYIIVAANYSVYPKCSVVETSLGPAKVYDTGGFAARHPTGFDLATDWSKGDGI